jgi:carbonic anhydrase/acetyltransferase-like protein (isoleucine patch superfamily)
MIPVLIRAFCVVSHWGLKRARVLYYNLRAFGWHKAAPWDTTIYGGLQFAHLPCPMEMGRGCSLGHGVFIGVGRGALITLGDDVSVNTGCHLVASESIRIGSHTAIGEYVSIRDQAHNFRVGCGVRGQGFKVEPVEIGENVWIGRGVFIGPGTRIGANSIVAANSVVHGVFPDGVLIAGAPAKVKRNLDAPSPQAAARALVEHVA